MRKGFTLIELLAVIVILTIISLIAVPIVINIIGDTKENAFKETVNGIVKAAKLRATMSTHEFTELDYNYLDDSWKGDALELEGEIPEYVHIYINNRGKTRYVINNGEYCAIKEYDEKKMKLKKIVSSVSSVEDEILYSDCKITNPWDGTIKEASKCEDGKNYCIYTAEELAWIANEVNNGNSLSGITIYIEADIDLSGRYSNGVWSGIEWIPIGDSTNKFKGNIDGQNHVIRGLYITNSNLSGLIGYAYYNTIKNLGIVESYINSKSGNTGMIAAITMSSKVNNCYTADGLIEGKGTIGGIVGYLYNASKIENSYNSNKINSVSASYVGGLVGHVYGGSNTISNSYNIGDIFSQNRYYTGGIVGYLNQSGLVDHCYNKGTINTKDGGGIAGSTYFGNIKNSYNEGTIIGTNEIGGIVGVIGGNENFGVENCYNIGDVKLTTTTSTPAGIAYRSDGKIKNSYNAGNITGGSAQYGIVSLSYATIAGYSNNYYKKQNNILGIGNLEYTDSAVKAVDEEFMKTKEFVELLNEKYKYVEGKFPIIN